MTRLATLPPFPTPPAPADVLLQVRLSLPPVSAARPRVSPAEYTRIGGRKIKTRKAHAYNPQDYEDYKRDVGWLFRLARVTRNDTDELGVYGIFHLALDAGVADGDNLLKAVVDAGNGIAWRDDRQFTEWLARVVRGSGDPHTDLVVYVTRRRGGAA
ncbi:MAG TPA: RusA family crossover junction endodeoxyribonuclease [Streptosporangiaceae bacterium]|nr:RusA family crossover junction endodeoxyribonuclease [Streptosporangiaceae bacterium]